MVLLREAETTVQEFDICILRQSSLMTISALWKGLHNAAYLPVRRCLEWPLHFVTCRSAGTCRNDNNGSTW